MDAVTAKAGVSKATVYGHFSTKETLFAAVIRARAEEVVGRLEPFGKPSGNPEADLLGFSQAFQSVVLVPEARAWQRLVIAESQRRPELAQALFESGPAKVLKMLEGYLRSETEAGRLRVERPADAADQLIGLNIGAEVIRGLLGGQTERSEAERKSRASQAVAVFLAAYGVPTAGRAGR